MITPKNACSGASALSGGGIAIIVALVPPDHLGSWKYVLIFLAVIMASTAISQMILTSREDRSIDAKLTYLFQKHGGVPNGVVSETTLVSVEGSISADGFWERIAKYFHVRRTPSFAFDGELYRAVTAPKTAVYEMAKSVWEAIGKKDPYHTDADVLFEMYLVNKSKQTVYIKDILASVEIDGQRVPLSRKNDFLAFEWNDKRFEYALKTNIGKRFSEEMSPLEDITRYFRQPLEPGKPIEGWVRFQLDHVVFEKLDQNRSYAINIIDSFGHEYRIVKASTQKREFEVGLRSVRS